jgi:hypothetical protein
VRKALTDESLKNLQRLKGEFRIPESRIRWAQVRGIGLAAFGVGFVWLFLHRYQELGLSFRLITTAVYGVVALIIGIRDWLMAGRWYKFGSGQVQSLTRSGTVLWDEDVLGIESGTISYDDRSKAVMTLRWANSKRRIDIYPSMAEALQALDPPTAPPGVPIDLNAPALATGAGPIGPDWRCKFCGEENPGNFEECWKCQNDRAGRSQKGSS